MAAPAALATRLLAARNLRRLVGCGCLATVAVVVLPVFMVFSVMSGLISGLGGAGGSQVDGFAAGAGAVLSGTGEPLEPGHFTVSQGFGCTTIRGEPPPPPPYACPPDEAHASWVRFHTGIDLAAAQGLPVYAVTAGTVRVIDSSTGFGIHIVLIPAAASPTTTTYLYGHLSGVVVADQTAVIAGQAIGFVGSTGNSTGPHLHFEVDIGGTPANPCSTFPSGYLVPPGVAAAGCLAWAM